MKKICILLADEGSNLKLAESFQEYLEKQGAHVELINLLSLDLPLYTYPKELSLGIPNAVKEMVQHFKEASGFVFVSPEYNGSIPPVLSSTIAWATRASKEWRVSFNEKPAAIASYSYTGAVNLFISLRIHLSYIGLNVLARPVPATPDKPLDQEDVIAVCDQLLSS